MVHCRVRSLRCSRACACAVADAGGCRRRAHWQENGRGRVVVAVAQATSNVEFVLPMDAVTVGIVSGLQFSADLTATPWLRADYVNNRWGVVVASGAPRPGSGRRTACMLCCGPHGS